MLCISNRLLKENNYADIAKWKQKKVKYMKNAKIYKLQKIFIFDGVQQVTPCDFSPHL